MLDRLDLCIDKATGARVGILVTRPKRDVIVCGVEATCVAPFVKGDVIVKVNGARVTTSKGAADRIIRSGARTIIEVARNSLTTPLI